MVFLDEKPKEKKKVVENKIDKEEHDEEKIEAKVDMERELMVALDELEKERKRHRKTY